MIINYSIIIPHRNIPTLLVRCLKSIPSRNDVEVIVIDDNSDSSIVDFDSFPGLNNPNIQVILDKSGKGAGHARNIGVERSRGKWLVFVDSDDFFNYCISDIFDKYRDAEEDIIFFNANSVDTETYMPCGRAKHLNDFIQKWETNRVKSENSLRYEFGEPWSKIVRRQIVVENGIRFDETPIHNDTTFSYLVGYYAKNIGVDNRAGYCITVRSGSTSVSINEKKEFVRIDVFARAERFFVDHGIITDIRWHYAQVGILYLRNMTLGRKGMNILKTYGLPRFRRFTLVLYYCIKFFVKAVFY